MQAHGAGAGKCLKGHDSSVNFHAVIGGQGKAPGKGFNSAIAGKAGGPAAGAGVAKAGTVGMNGNGMCRHGELFILG